MAYIVANTPEEALVQLQTLVNAFNTQHSTLKQVEYSEAQLRIDFINPLLKSFGWDIDNEKGQSQFLRDVIQEEPITVQQDELTTKKNPDYTLRTSGIRKLFVEAKKVAIDIAQNQAAAFQTRRYGWNATLNVSILTNFEWLIVYDCRHKPQSSEDAQVARYSIWHYKDYERHFEEIYKLLGQLSVAAGYLDNLFANTTPPSEPFDNYFLKQIESWRNRLGQNAIEENPSLTNEDINLLVQRLLNRIIFLRICEDREIEKYETIKNINSYEELKQIFQKADTKYNSGLFDFIEDDLSLHIKLNSQLLISIFKELYYPQSPYDFSIVDPFILSFVYERYLGSRIEISSGNQITIVEEPEVYASNGVVPTPKHIVDKIVSEALKDSFTGTSSSALSQIKVADICCGSGTFLLAVFELLVQMHVELLLKEGATYSLLQDTYSKSYRLTLQAKHNLLLESIYGVDINPYAVEVTKFSLYLKLLEDENQASVNNFLSQVGRKALPNLDANIKNGNSLVDNTYYSFNPGAIANTQVLYSIRPFDWNKEFPFLKHTRGFDLIVGNPPYVRIQKIAQYLGDEKRYYQHATYGYSVAQDETFDKYYLFIQKAVNLINDAGILSYIVPHKFFVAKGGKSLRAFLTTSCSVSKIIHFGVKQVFPGRSTYTAILTVSKQPTNNFSFARVQSIQANYLSGSLAYQKYTTSMFSEAPWVFVSEATQAVFDKIISVGTIALSTIANPTVGLQTSADEIYIFHPTAEDTTHYFFNKLGRKWKVEKSICKRSLYDATFKLFDIVEPNAQMIFPYHSSAGTAVVIPENDLKSIYPDTWVYLNAHRTRLSKRSVNGNNPIWYQYGRTQSLAKFQGTDKLIWKVLSKEPSYIYDTQELFFTGGGNGPYYSLLLNTTTTATYNLFYIMGILAHPIIETMIKARSSEFQGTYYSHGKQFILSLPIKTIDFTKANEKKQHDEIVRTVQSIISAKARIKQAKTNADRNVHQRTVDVLTSNLFGLVNVLYGLTEQDIQTVNLDELLMIQETED